MSDLQELRERVQTLRETSQKLEGRKATAEEELEKIRKEIQAAGFKNVKALKAAIADAEAKSEKYRSELISLLEEYEES